MGLGLAMLLLLLLSSSAAASVGPNDQLPPVDPESRLYARMEGLVVPYGYTLEEHFVETVDGYILRMFRIPHGCNEPSLRQPLTVATRRQLLLSPDGSRSRHRIQDSPGAAAAEAVSGSTGSLSPATPKPVVHFQHGLLGSSTDFVLNGPDNSLPMILADAGYDVWFGNVRGNVFSRNHTVLDILDADFWQFSWDEMAARDLPAMLTHELMTTGVADIAYVGHSQGTTIGMAFLSSGSALAQHIKIAVLLAPVAFVTHMDSLPMNALAAMDTDEVFTLLGFHEFLPSSEILSKLEGQMCKVQPYLCVNLLSMICGYNPDNIDPDRLPIYLNYTPSGTSVKNMAKWAQAVRSPVPDELHMFDYGTECRSYIGLPRPCNQVVYGQEVPPAYDFSRIKAPLVVFTGGADILADPDDTVILLKKLPKLFAHHHEPKYGHLDFIWGYNAVHRVYWRVLEVLASLP